MNGCSEEEYNLIRKAYTFAENAHKGQMRVSGTAYFVHSFGTACIVADMHMPATIIAAALLHDVLEDTILPRKQVKKQLQEEFSKDIELLVERVTKLSKVQYHGTARYIENLRKMFIAIAEDLRVVVLKFADRLNNLQDLDVLPKQKRDRVAIETIELYAPIANRLGMGKMKVDLEDSAFRYINPKAFEETKALLEKKVKQKDEYIKRIVLSIKKICENKEIKYTSIYGRAKRLYNFFEKLERHHGDINRIYDIIALRIILKDGIEDCYHMLGILHQYYTPLSGRIKDYIAQPKPNGYQSLHTTVFCEDGEVVEFQIRTEKMHEFAKYGIAAHWRYKESGRVLHYKGAQWMEELSAIRKKIINTENFMEKLEEWKLDLFQDRIFVFTPKGDVIDLPDGATPIDLAYAIHTDLGNTCVGARINDRIARLDDTLGSGDVCGIITDKNRKGPSLDWLESAKTRHAREKIRTHARRVVPKWIQGLLTKKNIIRKKKEKKSRK